MIADEGRDRLGFLRNATLRSRRDVLDEDVVPRSPGVYGWFFREIPTGVPTEGCFGRDGLTLLYVGIAPKAPPTNGVAPSKQSLRSRVRYHMNGNAEGSTLRLTLGCLLSKSLGIQLRRVGSGKRMTFTADGERKLSEWMDENAFVCWTVTERPWEMEKKIISTVCLPLNLDQNRSHTFHARLSACRSAAKGRAKELPIW